MNRFLSPQKLVDQTSVRLDETETHHLIHVLRAEVGEEILLIDGEGGFATGIVTNLERSGVVVEMESIERKAKPSHFGLAFGIPKPNALEFILKRGTEIGITAFQPLVTQHGHPASFFNAERWKRVVAEVCKQCEQLHFPFLLKPMAIEEYLKKQDSGLPLFACSETDREVRPEPLRADGAEILVGPEGGWSEDELGLISRAKARPLGLGKNRLRTEMAALSAVIRVQVMLETFSK